MTANQIIRELKKRKGPIIECLAEFLVESGLKDVKHVEVEKTKEVVKELSSEEKLKLVGEITELKEKLTAAESKILELVDQLTPAGTTTETIKSDKQ